jgi:hypothetical protein
MSDMQLTVCLSSIEISPEARDQFRPFHFVAFCESDFVASRIEKCQTRRTVGFLVLALIGTPASMIIKSDLPRLI